MPNQIIISMVQNYPFGQCQRPERQNNEILVRKQITTGNKDEHISKAKYLKKLKVPYSIQIISIFQDQQSLQIYYEYVPLKFQIWMKNMSDQLSNNLLKQLYILSTFLAQNKICTKFNAQQLGLDKNYHIKYFIDLDNTFYNEFQNISNLKQKYYRQINLFIKSFNSIIDKSNNPLFYSLDCQRSQMFSLQNSLLKSFPRNLQRASSLTMFQTCNRLDINLTESSQYQINQNLKDSKQSALKKSSKKSILNQKLKDIQRKLQIVKQNNFKINPSLLQLEKRTFIKQNDLKKVSILKKSHQNSKFNRGVSIDKLLNNKQKSKQSQKRGSKQGSECETQFSDKSCTLIKIQSKKNKSQKFKTPKNSQSPVEYLDIVKSASEYVQDFLNVLQDSSESEQHSFEQTKQQGKKRKESYKATKSLLKTQQSQNQNQSEQMKWRARFDAVIQNSKKLIDRMKSPPKTIESIVKS